VKESVVSSHANPVRDGPVWFRFFFTSFFLIWRRRARGDGGVMATKARVSRHQRRHGQRGEDGGGRGSTHGQGGKSSVLVAVRSNDGPDGGGGEGRHDNSSGSTARRAVGGGGSGQEVVRWCGEY